MKTKVIDSVLLGLGSLILGLWNLGASDLLNDEAKSALNIAYPHPPLVRYPMYEMSHIFGQTEWASNLFGGAEWSVRFPLVVLGVVAVVFAYLLFRELSEKRILAVLGAVVIGLLPLHLSWMRTGFLSTATEAAWFIALFSIAVAERDRKEVWPHWLLTGGLVFGMWSNIQTVLFYPAYAWFLWRHRKNIQASIQKFWAAIIGVAVSPIALIVYVLTNSDARWDMNRFLMEPPNTRGEVEILNWLWTTPLGYFTLTSLALAIFYGVLVRQRIIPRHPIMPLCAVTASILLLFGCMSSAPYYVPYLVPIGGTLLVYILMSLPGRWPYTTLGYMIAILLFFLPGTLRHPEHTTTFHDNFAEINALMEDQPVVPIIGLYGYEARHYVEKLIVHGVNLGDVKNKVRILVLRPDTLTDEEKRDIEKYFVPVKSWGEVTVYEGVPERVTEI